MRYDRIDPMLFVKNRRKLIAGLKPGSLVIVHSSDEFQRNGDQFFPFRQNSDMFYLTGLDQEQCVLCLCPDHPVEAMREIVFTLKTNDSMVTWYGPRYTREEASAVSGIKTVKWLDDFEDTLKDLMLRSEFIYLNDYENARFNTDVPSRDKRFALKLKDQFPLHKFERLATQLIPLRMCKEPEEIELMQKACNITAAAFRFILQFVKPGMMEYEVEAEITRVFLASGASGHAYYPIVASGPGACILHYIKNNRRMHSDELLLLDFGAEYANYAADLTRTIPVNGKYSKRQRECYSAVLGVMKRAKQLLIPGTTIEAVNREVAAMMEQEMIALGLFSAEDVKNQDSATPLYFKYYMHGNSHFIGLDVHDCGTRQMVLKPGMVLSCEPGLYVREEGLGIRIENDILVTENGPVDLMKDIPAEPDEIEALMNP